MPEILDKLFCKLFTHIFYWDNWYGRVCITCGYTETPEWLAEAKAKGRLEWARPHLRQWIEEQPGLAEEAQQGFEGIEAGRYRKVSRREVSRAD